MRVLLIVGLGRQPTNRGKKDNEIDGQKGTTQTIIQQPYHTRQERLNLINYRMKQ